MKRRLMTQLAAWKTSSKRKPLILQGVRQTGKTHLLTQFGHDHFKKFHIINFEKQTDFKKLFEEDLDPRRILNDLCFQLKTNIDFHQDLLGKGSLPLVVAHIKVVARIKVCRVLKCFVFHSISCFGRCCVFYIKSILSY